MLAKLWALLSRSWSRADLSQAFCHRRHLYSHNRRYSSNPCYFSLCPPASLHLLTNTAPPPGLSSRSSPPPQLPRQQYTNGTQICGSSNRSTSWSRNRPEECHRGIFLTSLTRVSRARWVPPLKSVQKGRLTARISKYKARNLRPYVCPSTISHVTGYGWGPRDVECQIWTCETFSINQFWINERTALCAAAGAGLKVSG